MREEDRKLLKLSMFNLIFDIEKTDRCIIYNPLSGSADLLKREYKLVFQKIMEKDRQWISQNGRFITYLQRRGYIYVNEKEESKEIRRKMKILFDELKKSPLHFLLIPTYFCNLKCPYCFESDIRPGTYEVMSKKTMTKAFEAIEMLERKEDRKSKTRVVLFGGEPLIGSQRQRRLIEDILLFCDQKNYDCEAITNGADLPDYIGILSNHNSFKEVQVTLDGPKNIHDKRRAYRTGKGTFDRIVRGVDELLKIGIKVVTRVNVDNQNIGYLPELARFIERKGWARKANFVAYFSIVKKFRYCDWRYAGEPDVMLTKFLQMSKENEELNVFTLEGILPLKYVISIAEKSKSLFPRFNFCGANHSLYCLDLNGDIYSCTDIVGKKEYRVGRFLPNLRIFRHELEKWRNRTVFSIKKCQKCDVNLICGGGCSFESLMWNGSINEPKCEPVKKIMEIGFNFFYPKIEKKILH